ncbi:MAG: serine hydrolase domain-containing protein [Bacteroidota bacterium]
MSLTMQVFSQLQLFLSPKLICLLTYFFLLPCFLLPAQTDSFILHTQTYLEELAQDEDFGLSITIAQGEEVLLSAAYGMANRAHRVPNRVDTKFNIASIGKMFTAVAILQLEEKGKLDLKKTLGQYVPDFPNTYIRDSVTIHQLLTHSGGLPLWFSPAFDGQPKFQYLKLEDFLPLYMDLDIDRSKIGQHSYSNVGFMALGYVIEAVSGQPYPAYLQAHIFDPLGMKETGLWSLTEIVPNGATGYMRPAHAADWWKPNHHRNKSSSPAGGAYASSQDLITFYQSLLANKLINASSLETMLSPQVESYYGHYGYGIGLNANNDQAIIGHLGGYYGVRGELLWYEAQNYLIAILANSDQTDYTDVSYFIKMQLTGTPVQKSAYIRTTELLQSPIWKETQNEEDIKELIGGKALDEALIQIKGYYHFNRQEYAQARMYFLLNSLAFPDSAAAQRDLQRVN